MTEIFIQHPKLLILLTLIASIFGSILIFLIAKISKKAKIKQFKIAGFGVELEGESKSPETSHIDASTSGQIAIPFENFNTMVKHCVKVAIEAAQYKYHSEDQTLQLQNKSSQDLLEEVMEKVNRTFHEKKIKESIENGALDPHHDISIVYFEEDFEDDFKSIVFSKLGQFLQDERLAFTDEIDLANMCESLKRQITNAIEDRFNREKYSQNRELAKESFNACRQALSEALNNSLHKAKIISITSYEDIKKATAKKDEDLNSFLQAYTQKELKNNFISKEILEGN